MLGFVFRRIKASRWMTASLLLGNLLLFCVVSAIPMYSDAILQSVMTDSLGSVQSAESKWSGSIHASFTARQERGYRAAQRIGEAAEALTDAYGVPVLARSLTRTSFSFHFHPEASRTLLLNSPSAAVCAKSGLEDHVEILRGRLFAGTLGEDGAIEVIVNAKTLARQDLMVGESYCFDSLSSENGEPLRFTVVGVFRASERSDPYWYASPELEGALLFAAPEVFDQVFGDNYKSRYSMGFQWDSVIDTAALDVARVEGYAADTAEARSQIEELGGDLKLAYEKTLNSFLGQSRQLNVLLWLLLVPILAMLLLFLFMVCRQILEQEKPTIAVLKSRGASRGQVVALYAAQSAILGLACAIVGLPLGFLLCRLIGASNGFLNLVSRTALPLRMVPGSFLYAFLALVLSVLTMTLPAVSYSAQTIVSQKRESARRRSASWLAILGAVLAIALSLYEWFSFHNQRQAIIDSAAAIDPVLYVSASVFLLGAGALVALLLPSLITLIFRAFEKRWSAPVYAAMLRARRATADQHFLMIFLVLTIAVGIFNATTARTINQNTEENLRYRNGADLVLQEVWRDNSNDETADMRIYEEPDFAPYEALARETGSQLTRVRSSNRYTVNREKVQVLGIETREFGQVAWMRKDLLPAHFYDYLNVLSQDPSGVLLSENYQDLGYSLGGTIEIVNENGVRFPARIVGFFEYWPSYFETDVATDYWGNETLEERWLIVGNLAQMQNIWGVEPYEIWVRTDNADPFYDFARDRGIQYTRFTDTAADLVDEKNDPVLQGTNGVLTVGFILVLCVCMAGFLIFWVLSIQGRTLQFGVFRAIGMPMRDLIILLVTEQVLVSLSSVAAGALVGVLAARLYVPLIQMSYTAMDVSLPLRIVARGSDYLRLFGVFGAVFLLCLGVLAVLVRRIRIAQALKLGED